MKLPDILTGILPKKVETEEYFFSLYVDRDSAAVAVWHLDEKNTPHVSSFAHAVVAQDSWESRIQVVDRLISAAEDKVGVVKAITKTVFGIPGAYLTAEGNIIDSIRPNFGKLSKLLELTPVGFVPLSQAIAFQLKQNEGIPPSVIIIGCSGTNGHVTLFRVGNRTYEGTIDIHEDPAVSLEHVLKQHQDGDVLPSRILLFGGNSSLLEEVRGKLLKHPWPTRTNFLHFPKIEVVDVETLLTAVSLAGASELSEKNSAGSKDLNADMLQDSGGVASTVVAQARTSTEKQELETSTLYNDDKKEETIPKQTTQSEEDVVIEEVDAEESIIKHEEDEDETEEGKEEEEKHSSGELSDDEDIANVQVVTPESLGFYRDDVLEHVPDTKQKKSDLPNGKKRFPVAFVMPNVHIRWPNVRWKSIASFIQRKPHLSSGILPFVIGGILCLSVGVWLMYALPRVTITVSVSALSVSESTNVTVDPEAGKTDVAAKIIPGKIKEQSVSGEKTIPVSGKKNAGDPAKGTVTIYNKVTNSRTLSKGSQLTSGNVVFTLDSDVSVASASESIGSITFGKATTNVTARDIGPNGNIAASSEFTFANIPGSQVSARNESAFSGGTSKQVTVVSRADQDSLIKALTEELVAKAKQQLLTSGESGELLIDQTIKTQVSEKIFRQELDEEAKELFGSITINVSGVAVAESEINEVLSELIRVKVPSEYAIAPEQTTIDISNVNVKKDGLISLTAKLTSVALPQIEEQKLQDQLVGARVSAATDILRQTSGVAAVEYRFTLSPTKNRLPFNRNNIKITVMVL